jgi:uncharacterized protein
MTQTPDNLDQPLSNAEIDEFAELIETLEDHTDFPLDLEALDGFITALICSPRLVMPGEYLPHLFGEDPGSAFADPAQFIRFMGFFTRRWNTVAQALNMPVDDLSQPTALVPFLTDWESTLAEMPAAERAEIKALGFAETGKAWAMGFLWVVETWEDDWTLLEADEENAETLEVMLDPFYTLALPEAELAEEDREYDRDARIAMAIWSAYDLRQFWRDAVSANTPARVPVRAGTEPGRNEMCPCGSGKKFKKCCGSPEKLH